MSGRLGGLLKVALGALLGFAWYTGRLGRLIDQATASLGSSSPSSGSATVSPGTSSGSTA